MIHSRRIRKPHCKQKFLREGATTVEFALVLPILLLILFGTLDCSKAIVVKETARFACYRGARVGATPGATHQSIREAVSREMDIVGIVNYNIGISPEDFSGDFDEVTVSVSVPLHENTLSGQNMLTYQTLFASCTLRTEGVRNE